MPSLTVSTSGLTRRFGSVTAVDGVELSVPAGCVYGFLGPNGAGKTTTIRLLLGLIRPHAGFVQLFDRPLAGDGRALLRRVGALVEAPSLYPNLTGWENLEVTRRLVGASTAQIGWALHTVHLEDVAHRRVGGYSSGMKQRLGLALALLNSPDLLILDEPTNGLDPAGIHEMRDLLRRLPETHGVTVFLSSHLLAEVEQVATHIGILQAGRLCFQGTLEELNARMSEQVVVGVGQPDQARQLLSQAGWSVRANGGHRLAVAVNGQSDAALINAQLVAAGVNVFQLNLEKPSLEDIFLRLTQA
ncbi:MAG TPA: ABC transporter ATP-binding protein [Anaerolineae bacterium]|nr:ABC transporter ATP-binding protein [Anaerolineae bacterium]